MADPAVFIRQLREVAGWYEAHPETPPPSEALTVSLYIYNVHSIKEAGFLLRLFAPCQKLWSDAFLKVVKTFPSGAKIEGVFNRSAVCTRQVIGTRYVPSLFVKEHIAEVVEWNCSPLLEGEAEQEGTTEAVPSSQQGVAHDDPA